MHTVLKQYASPKQTGRMERIVASVKRQLIEGGLESLNIRDLARDSKVSIATLDNRFGEKDKLIATAVIDHVRDVIFAPAARTRPYGSQAAPGGRRWCGRLAPRG